MSMVITNNTSALNTQRWLSTNNNAMTSSLQKLSSGYRINTAADAPAGLVISEKLRAQNVGLERAVQNTEEASNVIGIAEGALTEMNTILETMRKLALHAANDGVTSSDEIEADQAEMDSAIQTIDNIATTTKYSNEYLLNGNQSLTYDDKTVISNAKDIKLLDNTLTKVNQIDTTADYSISVSYTGASDTAETSADLDVNAQRAYFESSVATKSDSDYSASTNLLTADQEFSLSGNGGSKSFSFTKGTSIGDVAATINNASADTGVGCALIFDTAVVGTTQNAAVVLSNAITTNAGLATYQHNANEAQVFTFSSKDNLASGTLVQQNSYNVTAASATLANSISAGKNSDANGNIYVLWTSANSCKIYSDNDLSQLVGTGIANTTTATQIDITEYNDSDLTGTLTLAAANGAINGSVTVISGGAALEFSGNGNTVTDTGVSVTGLSTILSNNNTYASCVNGINLGTNTDDNGNIYVKVVSANSGASTTVYLYNDSAMTDDDLLCSSVVNASCNTGTGATLYDKDTGLQMTLDLLQITTNSTTTGQISFNNLALRLYSTEYGENEYVKIDVDEGELFMKSDGTNDLISSSSGEVVDYGQNAVVTVNGQRIELNGLSGTVSTAGLNADLVFTEGDLGEATISTVGYNYGSLVTGVGSMSSKTSFVTQALHNTTEVLDNFQGGMTFQLGEGAGESTVYSIESMTSSNLGQTTVTKDFDDDGTLDTKTLTISDLLGGGYACLASDATTALSIIDSAIDDVSALRARLGATQSNLLETNVNSLNVAIENITATESAIRDVDMATETTEYTKNQILVQSATSMLAQANSSAQNVLTLLQSL